MLRYRSAAVAPVFQRSRSLLTTPEGGKIALDDRLLALLQSADGRDLQEIVAEFRGQEPLPDAVRAAVACLAEAGLLDRESNNVQPEPPVVPSTALVSAIIVTYNSCDWLPECFESLLSQTHPALEAIVVDNGSSDGSADWVAGHYPQVKLLRLEKSVSLAAAINCGVAAGRGEYLLLLNPDIRLERDAVAQMLATALEDGSCAAVAAKLKFWWAPAFLNGIGNRVGPSSWGTDNLIGHLDVGQFDSWQEVPSACFAATLIPREAWDAVGNLDEGFPLYYEDSEWSYRARLLGYTVRPAPKAVVYHAFGGRVPSGEEEPLSPRKLRHAAYGRLRFALKILGLPYLLRFLRNYLVEDWRNFWAAVFRCQWPVVRAYMGAWRHALSSLPAVLAQRRRLQARRARRDTELFALQQEIPDQQLWRGLPELTWDTVFRRYLPLFRSGKTRPVPEFQPPHRRPHLLIVSNDVVDQKMAGPGLRYLEVSRALSRDLDVTLAVPAGGDNDEPALRIVRYSEGNPGSLRVLVENSDAVLISGYMVEKFPFLHHVQARLIVDLYDPFILENLHYYLDEPLDVQSSFNQRAVEVTNQLAGIGDFFICGSQRQRDFWMGVLAANNRVNPYTFSQDPTLQSLIDVVGIGFPEREPQVRPVLRGKPGFEAGSRIVLWSGGVWDWLDPLTLVHAWPQVLKRHPEARLVILGTRHPNPLVPRHKMAQRAQQLADEIGEKGRTIFFYEWLPYEELEGLLCEADVGVVLHPEHVETRYSIRTRVLDCLWTRLPVLVTDGDVTSEWVRDFGCGRVVPPQDPAAVADALCEILDRPRDAWTASFDQAREVFCWSRVVEPLRQYCLEGRRAPDREAARAAAADQSAAKAGRRRLARALYILRREGFRALVRRTWRYVRWWLARA